MTEAELVKLFSRNLRVQLAAREWTQEHLCEQIGLSRTSLSRAMHGKQRITLGRIAKICTALNCSPDKLFKLRDTTIGTEKI